MTLLAVTTETWIVTGLGFCMVLVLLFVFVYIMKGLGFIMNRAVKAEESSQAPQKEVAPQAAPAPKKASKADDATKAAIAYSLYLAENDDVAAVAFALSLYYGQSVNGVPAMTIVQHPTKWNNLGLFNQ